MEDGYTQLGTVLTDRRPEDSEGNSVIVVGRFKGDPYDGVELSYDAGRRNLYLTPEGALRLAFLLAAGSRKGYRHPVGVKGSRWLTTEIRLLGLAYGRPDIAPETQRGALRIALIPGRGVSVGISGPQGWRTAQDHPRGHANTVCVADCRSSRCTPEETGPTDAFLAAEIHRSAGPVWVPQWLTTGRGQCGDHIHVHLIDLGICVRLARCAHNHAKTARNRRRSLRSAVADTRLIRAEGRTVNALQKSRPP
jgi:hypothetical protein